MTCLFSSISQSSESVELQIDYWSSAANPSPTPGGKILISYLFDHLLQIVT